jgi:acetylornithine deacetylase/succinyl-diaminopimelate desuccinylase-like protein
VAARLAEAGVEPVLLESAPGRANVVARVAGREPDAPALLVHGHLDVVPADPSSWTVPPFAGEIRDGVLWGRGAVDMKNADAVLLAVVSQWARDGIRPRRDVVLAFTADEEDTAEFGAQWLVERHAELFEGCTEAVGESGAFTFHAGPGQRLYPIASAERGTAWLRLTARGRAGHGAKPNPENAVTRLSAAMARIGTYRWPVRLIPTVQAAVEAIAVAAGHSAPQGGQGGQGALPSGGFAGMEAEELLAYLGPGAALVAGTIRNSANPTQLAAGYKVNVIPDLATGSVDGRVLPGFEEEFRRTLDELTGPEVSWEYAHREIPLEAPLGTPLMASMTEALLAEDPGGTVVPYCMSGGTDAKHFAGLGMTCYGFTPLVLPEGYDYYAMFHGTDERIPLSALESAVRIMDRFLRLLPHTSGRDRPSAKIYPFLDAHCSRRSEGILGAAAGRIPAPVRSCLVCPAKTGHVTSCCWWDEQEVTVTAVEETEVAGTLWLGGRYRLDERITAAGGRSVWQGYMWRATDELLCRPVAVRLLPRGVRVPAHVMAAVQAAARVNDPRLATIYDTDCDIEGPYIVSEWTQGTHLEDLVLSGLPSPALAATMIADAADALAVAHRAGRPHLCLNPRSLSWDPGSGLKITGLGIDAALSGVDAAGPAAAAVADTMALARMLYALLTGCWPGDEPTALPAAPRHHGHVYTPRQVRAGVPGVLDAITCRALQLQATSAVLSPAGLAVALRAVVRPSYSSFRAGKPTIQARHARSRAGVRHRTTLLHPAALPGG